MYSVYLWNPYRAPQHQITKWLELKSFKPHLFACLYIISVSILNKAKYLSMIPTDLFRVWQILPIKSNHNPVLSICTFDLINRAVEIYGRHAKKESNEQLVQYQQQKKH